MAISHPVGRHGICGYVACFYYERHRLADRVPEELIAGGDHSGLLTPVGAGVCYFFESLFPLVPS